MIKWWNPFRSRPQKFDSEKESFYCTDCKRKHFKGENNTQYTEYGVQVKCIKLAIWHNREAIASVLNFFPKNQ